MIKKDDFIQESQRYLKLSIDKDVPPKDRYKAYNLSRFLNDVAHILFSTSGQWKGPLRVYQIGRIYKIALLAYKLAKALIKR